MTGQVHIWGYAICVNQSANDGQNFPGGNDAHDMSKAESVDNYLGKQTPVLASWRMENGGGAKFAVRTRGCTELEGI